LEYEVRAPAGKIHDRSKDRQLKQLGFGDQSTTDYEEDHLISLELGGNPTDSSNLWPEPYNASISDGGARYKDKVENYLHEQVCAGSMTLREAQTVIVNDWYKVYKQSIESKFATVEGIDANDQ